MHSPTPPMLSPDPGAVRERALKMHDRLIDWRRHLHRHPELSEQEFQTSAFIQEVLTSLGIPFTAGVADTGVVGLIEGMMPGQGCVALRADMDALPIAEANAVDYRSQNPGVMHACGHDAHTASLLGAAALLQEMRAGFGGTVKLLFQPSEEQYPGGAIRMIREGVLEDPNPAFIFGQHVLPTLDTGKVGFHPGPAMASTDEVHLTVIGRGGHGATPELVTDPVTAAAHILIALQQVVSRKANPLLPTVLSFGRVIADGRTNIIPDQVEMHGILRTFDETWRTQAREHITRIAQQTAAAFGTTCEVFIDPGYPFLVNDPTLTLEAMEWAREYLGTAQVEEIPARMTSEDFAYFSQQRPSCFYRLGVRNEARGIASNLHTPTFDIDEQSLATGAGLMAFITLKALEKLQESQ